MASDALEERLASVEALLAQLVSAQRHADEARTGPICGALHGFPRDLRKRYHGPVTPQTVVMARFDLGARSFAEPYFAWLDQESALPRDMAARLDAAPGHAAIREAWARDRAFRPGTTCADAGLPGVPGGRDLLAWVATELAHRRVGQHVMHLADDHVMFHLAQTASLADVLACLRAVLEAFGVLHEVRDLEVGTLSTLEVRHFLSGH